MTREAADDVERGDKVRYRHEYYDPHAGDGRGGETVERYTTYTVGHLQDTTITLQAVVSDGEGSVTIKNVTELDVTDLGRCAECDYFMAYSDDECYECADTGDAE